MKNTSYSLWTINGGDHIKKVTGMKGSHSEVKWLKCLSVKHLRAHKDNFLKVKILLIFLHAGYLDGETVLKIPWN